MSNPEPLGPLAFLGYFYENVKVCTMFFSRNHAVEYHILSELVAELKNGIEKYSYMVELAKNMCITGNLYQERYSTHLM